MTASSYDPTTGAPVFLDSDAPDPAVNPSQVAAYAAEVGTRLIGSTTERTAYTYAREGLGWYDTTIGAEYIHDGAGWVKRASTVLLGEWHKNIVPGSSGGQDMGPITDAFAITAAPYARAIRVTVQGGVFPSGTGDGGVEVVPSTGAWAGGTNVHRVNAPAGSFFTPYAYVFYMASLPVSTALTLTLNSISSTTCGYDFHFIVEEIG